MARKSEGLTRTLVLKLLLCTALYYACVYAVAGVLVGAFGVVWWEAMGTSGAAGWALMPFDWANINPALPGRGVAVFVDHAVGYALLFLVVFVVVRAAGFAWDYVVSIALLHFALTCIVTLSFPTSYIWWVTYLVGVLVAIGAAELACFGWETRTIKLE